MEKKERSRLFCDIDVASISPATSDILKQYNIPAHIEAVEKTPRGMVEEIVEFAIKKKCSNF